MEPTPEVLRAIETAVQIEKEGLAFYTEAAGQTDDPRSKRIFHALAKDEAAHLELFEDARQALLDRGNWPSPQEVAAISPGQFDHPPIFRSEREGGATEGPERLSDVLRRGVQAEEASIAFYSKQMDGSDDPHARAMYAYLIEQEQVHRAILQTEYDYLVRTHR